MPANCNSSTPWKSSGITASLLAIWSQCERWNGSSMPSRPSGVPQQVLDYVGSSSHRVEICNIRLLDIEAGQVRFQWKDYRDKGEQKTMTLSAEEFIRRFLLHALPEGFQRIRYSGFLRNRERRAELARCRPSRR